MEPEENESNGVTANVEYKGAHQAFRDRWKQTDDTMCRHSMSFHLHHTLRSEFFASYLYLLEKIPLGKKEPNTVQYSTVQLLIVLWIIFWRLANREAHIRSSLLLVGQIM